MHDIINLCLYQVLVPSEVSSSFDQPHWGQTPFEVVSKVLQCQYYQVMLYITVSAYNVWLSLLSLCQKTFLCPVTRAAAKNCIFFTFFSTSVPWLSWDIPGRDRLSKSLPALPMAKCQKSIPSTCPSAKCQTHLCIKQIVIL